MNNYLTQLRPELRLLLALCGMKFSEYQKHYIAVLMNQVTDWDYFVKMSNEHGVIALCWINIGLTGNADLIPKEKIELMHKGYLISLTRNTKIYSLLDEVLEIAEKNNIKVVLLKGLALEKTIYENKGLRQMNDLDILVKRENAVKLRKLLLKNGFDSMPMISSLHEKILPNYGKHLPEMYKEGLTVEIHFNLFDLNGDVLTKQFIDNSKKVYAGFKNAFYPADDYHLLYLVKHLGFHERGGTSQLRLYNDLLLLSALQNHTLDSGTISTLAEKAGIKDLLDEKWFQLNCFFNNNDEQGTISVSSSEEKESISQFLSYLNSPVSGKTMPEESLLKPINEIKGGYRKFLFITGYLFPSLEFMKYRYKTKSIITAIVCYPLRWIKLIRIPFAGKY